MLIGVFENKQIFGSLREGAPPSAVEENAAMKIRTQICICKKQINSTYISIFRI